MRLIFQRMFDCMIDIVFDDVSYNVPLAWKWSVCRYSYAFAWRALIQLGVPLRFMRAWYQFARVGRRIRP